MPYSWTYTADICFKDNQIERLQNIENVIPDASGIHAISYNGNTYHYSYDNVKYVVIKKYDTPLGAPTITPTILLGVNFWDGDNWRWAVFEEETPIYEYTLHSNYLSVLCDLLREENTEVFPEVVTIFPLNWNVRKFTTKNI